MIKVTEVQHMVDNVEGFQSRTIQVESFEQYCANIHDSLPKEYLIKEKRVEASEYTQAIMVRYTWMHPTGNVEMIHCAVAVPGGVCNSEA